MSLELTPRGLLDDLAFVASQDGSVRDLYDRAAPNYAHFRELWLELAGRRTEDAMFEAIHQILRPGMRVLDAGAGTGAISRRLLRLEPDLDLTLVDLSPQMLAQAADVPGQHLVGDIAALELDAGSFDVIVCAWVIETVPDPVAAVSELLRVLAADGFLLYTFCSLPGGWVSRAATAAFRKAVTDGFAGTFLGPEDTPWHDCDRSRRVSFHGGLSTLVVLRACCPVGERIVPATHDDVPPSLLP